MRLGHRKSDLTRFSPRQLFKGSEVGGWWDASDLKTMFTDTGATTPVTADAQVVLRWNDKSGRGNNVTEATNGPAYKVDGGGCLRFDGTNDLLSMASAIDLYAAGQASVFACLKSTALTSRYIFSVGSSGSNNPIYAPLFSTAANAANMSVYIRNDAGNELFINTNILQTGVFAGQTVVAGTIDTGTTITGFKNGIAGTVTSYSVARTGVVTQDKTVIGALSRATPTAFIPMDLYELVVIGRLLSEAEIKALTRYLGRPRGVFL